MRRGFAADVRQGVRWGFTYACIYGFFAAISFLVRGSARFEATVGVDLLVLLAGFLLAGLTGGLLVGIFLPLGARLMGAVFLGWLGAAPAFALGGLAFLPWDDRFGIRLLVVTLGGSLTLGTLCGGGVWFRRHGRR
jgi:hypothetical protein